MKKFLKYNIPAAVIALLLVIMLSVFGGVNRTAASLAGQISSVYLGDADRGSGRYGDVRASVEAYLDGAERLAAQIGDDGRLTAALEACRELRSAPFGDRNAFLTLADAAGAAYHAFAGADGRDESALSGAKALYTELEALQKRLAGYTEYEEAAERYNRTISGIPGRFLVFHRQEAVLFR